MARDLDKIADVIPTVGTKKRKPITPFILDLIKKKRQLWRQKNLAHNDIGRMQKIQHEMNLIGNQIKKEQEREKKFNWRLHARRYLMKMTLVNFLNL